MGTPTLFIRTANCNHRCPGWGVKTTLPDGREVTGCDSPHSVFPEIFRLPGNSSLHSSESLIELIPEYPRNICLTGGEPLLQWKRVAPAISQLLQRGQTVEVFTNGSLLAPYKTSLVEEIIPRGIRRWYNDLTYVMDFKPPSSGEFGKFNSKNFSQLDSTDSIKFVIGDRGDYNVAKSVVQEHRDFKGTWWMGVVFNRLDPQVLIKWILEDQLDVRLNLQTQSLMKSESGESFDEAERHMFKLV